MSLERVSAVFFISSGILELITSNLAGVPIGSTLTNFVVSGQTFLDVIGIFSLIIGGALLAHEEGYLES